MSGSDDDLSQFWEEILEPTRSGKPNGADSDEWPEPDMTVLRLQRRPPPPFPLRVLGDAWGSWVTEAAAAASWPVDFVMMPLLTSISALIGHARWVEAVPRGWKEPPHLWAVSVGDSGDGKSPGADSLMRDILPELEHRMIGDFPDRHEEWRQAEALDKNALKVWEKEQRAAMSAGKPFPAPMPKPLAPDIEPQEPCLRQFDITIEEVAAVLATAAPKGLLVIRDEVVGWLDGMNSYNPAGRAFWIESYGGRAYRVARRKHSGKPIDIPRLAVAVNGGTQPERLAKLLSGTDDGLLARVLWAWPDPIPFKLGHETPRVAWVVEAFDRLRMLEMGEDGPVLIPLTGAGRQLVQEFGREMQLRRDEATGLMRSAFGKARGLALRLSINLEFLWWAEKDGIDPPPTEISPRAFVAAATLVSDYFMPMAARVIVEADWLRPPPKSALGTGRARVAYAVNPRVFESASA
jgi:hypothetical protein